MLRGAFARMLQHVLLKPSALAATTCQRASPACCQALWCSRGHGGTTAGTPSTSSLRPTGTLTWFRDSTSFDWMEPWGGRKPSYAGDRPKPGPTPPRLRKPPPHALAADAAAEPSAPPFNAREHIHTVQPVGYAEVADVEAMVTLIMSTMKPSPQDCMHMLCRLGQLSADYCAAHTRLPVDVSRRTRTAMERLDLLLLKEPTTPSVRDAAGKVLERKKVVGLSRLAQLDAYALIQMTNGLLQLVLARRPKVHRVAFGIVEVLRKHAKLDALPPHQRWPYWSMLMFNLSDTPGVRCKATPLLQQLFDDGMVALAPLLTSPAMCPANCLSSFLLAAAKTDYNLREGSPMAQLIPAIEEAVAAGRVMADATPRDWVDALWACVTMGHLSAGVLAERTVAAVLADPGAVNGRTVADLLVCLMAMGWYRAPEVAALAGHAAARAGEGDGNAQVYGDVLWALGGMRWYDEAVYEALVAGMVAQNSKDPRAVARTFYACALAGHITPRVAEFAQLVSGQKRLNGWSPHELADLVHGWALMRCTGRAREHRGLLLLWRALMQALFWHKTPAHYRNPDHVRLHEATQVINSVSMGTGAPLPVTSRILSRSAEVAEAEATKRARKPARSPEQQAVHEAVARALREGGAKVKEDAVVAYALHVPLLTNPGSCPKGLAVEVVGPEQHMVHPPGRLTGPAVLRHALLREHCNGLVVLQLGECLEAVSGDGGRLVALLAGAMARAREEAVEAAAAAAAAAQKVQKAQGGAGVEAQGEEGQGEEGPQQQQQQQQQQLKAKGEAKEPAGSRLEVAARGREGEQANGAQGKKRAGARQAMAPVS